MEEYANLLLWSMVARDPGPLPLADRYAATENSVAGSLNMMSFWRTVTGVKEMGQCIVDPVAGQMLVTANLDERGSSTAFCGRLKIEDDLITELELYSIRSRAQAGCVMLADQIGMLPDGWTSPIPPGQKATREELLQLGRAIFDNSLPVPEPSPECLLMVAGGIVFEDPYYTDRLFAGETGPTAFDGKVAIVARLGPDRPSDPKARVVVIDEEQGVVVAIGLVPGFVSPYVVPGATESRFVPTPMIAMHHGALDAGMMKGRRLMTEMPAVAVSVQLVRMHSGKLQGLHMYNVLQGPGGGSPWV